MIPLCRDQGCQRVVIGLSKCKGLCLIAHPGLTRPTLIPSEMAFVGGKDQRVHLGSGEQVTPNMVSRWRPKPPEPEPWFRGLCGAVTAHPEADVGEVTCADCLKAHKQQRRPRS